MPIVSPAGDPSDDKHLWWRCVFIAAGIQPILILLSLIFRTTGFMIILMILYFPCIVFAFQNPASLPILLSCCQFSSRFTPSFLARSFISCAG